MNLKRFLCTLILVTCSGFVYAQQSTSQATLVIDSKGVNPHEKVKVSLQSYSFDVNTAVVEWFINDKPVQAGMGMKDITINAGNVGEVVLVTSKTTLASGEVLTTSILVSPQSVDLVWEAPESYVPPFYEGRSLPGEEAGVLFTAIPNMSDGSSQLAPENISYAWFVNEKAHEEFAGLGKQTALIYLDSLTSVTEVKVRARTPKGAVTEKTVSIRPHPVLPLIYRYDDTLGLDRARALFRRFETVKNFTLSLEPYFLSTKGTLSDSITYTWLLDGLPVTPQEKTLLGLQPKENSYGTKSLSITIFHARRFLQKASTDLEILFDTRQ